MAQTILGVDIGATGIKAGLVQLDKGVVFGEKLRLLSPKPMTPAAVSEQLEIIISHFEYAGEIGIGFPATIRGGECVSANHIDAKWLGLKLDRYFEEKHDMPVRIMNDADCAGVAELRFGRLSTCAGTGILLTIGTGIGSALVHNGNLVPNVELGIIRTGKKHRQAEHYLSNKVRLEEGLSWKKWAARMNMYFETLDAIFSPMCVVLGGGISKKFDKYARFFEMPDKIHHAAMYNDAGIIGAASLWHPQSSELLLTRHHGPVSW